MNGWRGESSAKDCNGCEKPCVEGSAVFIAAKRVLGCGWRGKVNVERGEGRVKEMELKIWRRTEERKD